MVTGLCVPHQIPPGDPRLPTGKDSCIPVFRSAPVCGTGTSAFNFGAVAKKREQINTLTAFLDMGQVYASEDQMALDLRDLTNNRGLLRVNDRFTDAGRPLLPFSIRKDNMCATRKRITNITNAQEVPCFMAGWHISLPLPIYIYIYSIYLNIAVSVYCISIYVSHLDINVPQVTTVWMRTSR